MKILPQALLPVLVLCSVAATARADRFHLGSVEEAAKMAEGSSPDVIEGVLLREENGNYVLRVEGGEIRLAKSLVYKIDKDGLTVADIEKREEAATPKLAQADQARHQMQAAEATTSARGHAAEASARREQAQQERNVTILIDFQGLLPNYRFKTYDPVLHRVNLIGLQQVIQDYLRNEVLRAAYRSK